MSRSYREIPPGHFANPHFRAFEEKQRQMRIEKARQESEVLRRIRIEETERKAEEKLCFCLWYMLDVRLGELEKQRDEHTPTDRDADWDETFCEAIRDIPRVREMRQELWHMYLNLNRPEFADWL